MTSVATQEGKALQITLQGWQFSESGQKQFEFVGKGFNIFNNRSCSKTRKINYFASAKIGIVINANPSR